MARIITNTATVAFLGLAASLLAASCSSDNGDDNTISGDDDDGAGGTAIIGTDGGDNGTGNSSSVGSGGGSSTSSGGGTTTIGNPEGVFGTGEVCTGLFFDGSEPAPDCMGEAYEAEALPINLYIMMDRSVSMLRDVAGLSNDPAPAGQSRWDGVSQAIREFANDPQSAGVGVGIQFFGNDILASEELNCNPANYANPMVPMGVLPTVGPDIIDAVDTMAGQLGGLTPTLPALQGAIQYAAADAQSSGRQTVVLLVTDGQPTQCQDPISIAEIADEAARGLEENNVMTFVVGLGAGLFNLHRIAQSGGTGSAYLIEGGDAAEQFRQAITNITTTPLSCEFDIPEPLNPEEQFNPDEVQMVYYPANGQPEEIPKLGTGASCGNSPNGGWFYNSTANPETIHICTCNCNRLGAGRIEVRMGCEPRVFNLG